jgi:DNA repair protein RecN (Recombination protein N)
LDNGEGDIYIYPSPMLTQLSIRDYALIDRLDVDFGPGFNVITGETGAGKSIIVEALSLLLGDRAKADVIRTGKEKAVIQGVFTVDLESTLMKNLPVLGVDPGAGELIVRREIVSDGKNRCLTGGLSSPLQTVKTLGDLLVDFHGQNEHQTLFKPESHLAFLDAFAETQRSLGEYKSIYSTFKAKQELLASLVAKEKSLKEKKDFLEHQFKELAEAGLREGKEEDLLSRIRYLESGQQMKDLRNELSALLGDEVLANFARARKPLSKLAEIGGVFADKLKTFDDLSVLLKELVSGLSPEADGEDPSEWNLDDLNAELSVLSRLKRKYGKDEKGLIGVLDETKQSLAFLANTGVEKGDLEKEIALMEKDLLRKAEAISSSRKKAAKKFDQSVASLLRQMNMDAAVFTTVCSRRETCGPDGLDSVEFLVSPNPGEPVRPLSKIASGGEIARVMLAIKSVLAGRNSVPILIFDEIDTGIGGETAGKVGALLKSLSRFHQVFCITHSHLIAREADAHYAVDKQVKDGRTRVTMALLDKDERVREIARMLGSSGSKAARAHAETLVGR